MPPARSSPPPSSRSSTAAGRLVEAGRDREVLERLKRRRASEHAHALAKAEEQSLAEIALVVAPAQPREARRMSLDAAIARIDQVFSLQASLQASFPALASVRAHRHRRALPRC